MREESMGRIDLKVNILDPTPNCPAHPHAAEHIVADFKDEAAIRRLSEISDVLSYEIELGDAEALITLRDEGARVIPSPETLKTIQDKSVQKKFLLSRGVPVPRQAEVRNQDDLRNALRDFGYPAMLKARMDSYDGRGNFLIRRPEDVNPAFAHFSRRSLMVEEFITWRSEISVIAARGTIGDVATFPVGENIHENSILKMTVMPARVSEETTRQAQLIARRVLDAFDDCGVFGVEMFELEEGKVLVNEVAPRVHNSGHGTLERAAYETSQFEQHLRAICGLPLGETTIKRPVVMHNILGEESAHRGKYMVEGIHEAESIPGVHVHMYGKEELRPRRKMGHLSAVGEIDVSTVGKRLNRQFVLQRLIERAVRARGMIQMVPVNGNA